MKISGKTAIVTGGAGDIGFEICKVLAEHKVEVISLDRKQRKDLELFNVQQIVCDAGNSEEFTQTLSQLANQGRQIDILINCLGVSPKMNSKGEALRIGTISLSEWNKLLEINLNSYFICMQHLMPKMMERGYGRVINVSSYVARNGGNTAAAHYVSSKAAILGLTKAAAKEGGPRGVTVNAVNPGRIETAMSKDQTPEVEERIRQTIPLGRLGQPREIAGCVAFLASEYADYITGTAIEVNGGAYMGP